LSQGNYDLYIPVKEEKPEGYGGRGETFPFGDNVFEVPADEVKNLDMDIILFQSRKNYISDQYEILSPEQRELPKIYLEHDPPREVPTDTKHIVEDYNVLLVHVTHFNSLMWNNNNVPTKVIEHGVMAPDINYSGELERGIVVINNIEQRGRRLGFDIFLKLQEHIPLDLIGMGTEKIGLGEIKHSELPRFISKYRFFFNPIRYTSLGLSVLEAMMIGMPVVGLATTELAVVIQNTVSGYIHTDINYLADKMKNLLQNKTLAKKIGSAGKKIAMEHYNITQFITEWESTFQAVWSKKPLQKTITLI